MLHSDLSEKLQKLRLLAAVLYDQGTAAGLSETQKEESIKPLRINRDALIAEALKSSLPDLIIAIKDLEDQAHMDTQRARRHQEKAEEALGHANHMKALLRADMEAQGQENRAQAGYSAVLTAGRLELR